MDKQKLDEIWFPDFVLLKREWVESFGPQLEESEALLLKRRFRTKDRMRMKPDRLN